MVLIKGLIREENGQGLTEYALVLGLVVLGFWVAVRTTNLGTSLSGIFNNVKTTVGECC